MILSVTDPETGVIVRVEVNVPPAVKHNSYPVGAVITKSATRLVAFAVKVLFAEATPEQAVNPNKFEEETDVFGSALEQLKPKSTEVFATLKKFNMFKSSMQNNFFDLLY